MGVDIYVLDFLLSQQGHELGDTLCLGRQSMNLADTDPVRQALHRHGVSASLAELKSGDGFAEPLLMRLGARSVQSIDASA